jgi:hypothetical protein
MKGLINIIEKSYIENKWKAKVKCSIGKARES